MHPLGVIYPKRSGFRHKTQPNCGINNFQLLRNHSHDQHTQKAIQNHFPKCGFYMTHMVWIFPNTSAVLCASLTIFFSISNALLFNSVKYPRSHCFASAAFSPPHSRQRQRCWGIGAFSRAKPSRYSRLLCIRDLWYCVHDKNPIRTSQCFWPHILL